MPQGGGHGGSRSLEVGGSALLAVSDKVLDKAKRIAGHVLEAALADLAFEDGHFSVAGTDRSIAMHEVIQASCIAGVRRAAYRYAAHSGTGVAGDAR